LEGAFDERGDETYSPWDRGAKDAKDVVEDKKRGLMNCGCSRQVPSALRGEPQHHGVGKSGKRNVRNSYGRSNMLFLTGGAPDVVVRKNSDGQGGGGKLTGSLAHTVFDAPR